MKKWRIGAITGALVMAAAAMTAGNGVAAAKGGDEGRDESTFTFALIGDIPYGDAQIAALPGRIDQLNADPDVRLVTHLGDIKSGSSSCSDAYFASIKAQFDRVRDPLVYTPGDNEWTDCHRANNGGYDPLERLAKIRSVFFPHAGRTLGIDAVDIDSQADQGYPENVWWERAKVDVGVLHIVGSNNSLANWTGRTMPTPAQTAEVLGRTAADIALIRDTFARARDHDKARAVVLMTQADMFDPTVPSPSFADWYGFQPIVQAIAQEAGRFDGPVYLFDGDSHVYNSDHPLGVGSSWLSLYGVAQPVPNLTRITVEGSTSVDEWVKVTFDRRTPEVVTTTRVPFHA